MSQVIAVKMKTIQACVAEDRISEAITKCEALASTPEGQSSFVVQCTLAQLYATSAQPKRAIEVLEGASLLEALPLPKLRQLADLYEAAGEFSKQLSTLVKLYETARGKSNVDKMLELAELIIAANTRAKTYQQLLTFLHAHLADCGASMPADKVAQRLADLVTTSGIISKAESAAKRPGLGLGGGASLGSSTAASTAAAAAAPIDNPWEKHYPLLLRMQELPDQIPDPALSTMLQAFADQWSRQLQQNAEDCLPDVLDKARTLLTSHVAFAPAVPDLTSVVLLCWFYSGEALDEGLRALAESLLSPSSSRAALGHSVLAVALLEAGDIRQSAAHLTACAQAWLAERAEKTKAPAASSSSSSSSSSAAMLGRFQSHISLLALLVGQALLDFRSLSVHDVLHLSHEARRALEGPALLPARGPRRGWPEAVAAARVRSLARVSPIDAMNDMLTAFPALFDADAETGAALLKSLLPSTQWLCVLALSDLGLSEMVLGLPLPPSAWLAGEQARAQLLRLVQAHRANPPADRAGICLPATHSLLRHTRLAAQSLDPVLSALRAALALPGLEQEALARTQCTLGLALFLADPADKACLAALLASAKADPTQGPVYCFIGHYYAAAGDADRAAKCYLKALAANVLDHESGVALSELYLAQGPAGEAKAVQLWADASASCPMAHWPFALRGQHHLHHLRADEAVHDLQQALELRAGDADSWQALGRCYLHNRQYQAAHKSLLRALDLAPRDFLVLCALADTARHLVLLPAAQAYCDGALALRPLDAVAAKVCAEISLCLAYQHYSCGWMHGASRCVLRGIVVLGRVLERAEGTAGEELLESAFKLSGDLHCFARLLGPVAASYDADVNSSTSLVPKALSDCHLRLYSLLARGEAHYRTVLRLCAAKGCDPQTQARCWHDIGCSLYYQVCARLQAAGQGTGLEGEEGEEVGALRARAMEAFSSGLRLDPASGACWVGLAQSLPARGPGGDSSARRQACLVRAAEVDATQHAAYANLGMLYGRSGEGFRGAAEACFSALQLIESNPLVWVGLGALFENGCGSVVRMKIGADGKEEEEEEAWSGGPGSQLVSACDAYESALEVAKPTEALLGSALMLLKARSCLAPSGALKVPSLLWLGSGSGGGSGGGGVGLALLSHRVAVRLRLYLERMPVHPVAWAVLAWSWEMRSLAAASAARAVRCAEAALEAVARAQEMAVLLGAGGAQRGELRALLHGLQRAKARCGFRLRLASAMRGGPSPEAEAGVVDQGVDESLAGVVLPAGGPEHSPVLSVLGAALEAASTSEAVVSAVRSAMSLAAALPESDEVALYASYLAVLRAISALLPLAGDSLDSEAAAGLWSAAAECALRGGAALAMRRHVDCFLLCAEAVRRRGAGEESREEELRALLTRGCEWHPESAVVLLLQACATSCPLLEGGDTTLRQQRERRQTLRARIDRAFGVGREDVSSGGDGDGDPEGDTCLPWLPLHTVLARALLCLAREAEAQFVGAAGAEARPEGVGVGVGVGGEVFAGGVGEAWVLRLRACRLDPALLPDHLRSL